MNATSCPKQSFALETLTWIATAAMLGTYVALTAGWMAMGTSFLLGQLAGQVAITAVSISKRAWQPALVNVFFGIASLAGLARLHLFAGP
jgi:hypothetical protein